MASKLSLVARLLVGTASRSFLAANTVKVLKYKSHLVLGSGFFGLLGNMEWMQKKNKFHDRFHHYWDQSELCLVSQAKFTTLSTSREVGLDVEPAQGHHP